MNQIFIKIFLFYFQAFHFVKKFLYNIYIFLDIIEALIDKRLRQILFHIVDCVLY